MFQQNNVPVPTAGNPFTPGRVVPPERFVGRSRELTEMLARLENMMSVSLVGQARIGKSSLLRYLEARLSERMREHGTYLPIYLSMDGQGSQGSFCKALLERLLPHIPPVRGQERALRALEHKPSPTLEETARALEWAAQGGLRVVLLLDEFKDLLERPQEFDEVFRGMLRSLYTHSQIALVMATRQSLIEIHGLNAYFVNGVDQQFLGTLPADEAEALLRQPHDHPFTAAEVRIGLDAGRGHPLRLQWAGFLLYQSKHNLPGLLHTEEGALQWFACRTLNREVKSKYDLAMEFSNARLDQQPANHRRGLMALPWRLTASLGRLASKVGDGFDQIKAGFFGVAILIFILLILLYLLGYISWEQLKELWSQLIGG